MQRKWISLYRASEEIRALSIFRHPRFITPITKGADTKCLNPWIPFPFLPVTLRDLLTEHLITDADKSGFTVQLIEILRYLRSVDWMHGDLKPDNFCIQLQTNNKARNLLLIDFGAAHPIHDTYDATPKRKTPWYKPPDEINKAAFTVDMWSVGIILMESLIGLNGIA